MTVLRTPELAEAEILTRLCLRSKAVWGYDEAFMAACRPALTVTAVDWQQSDIQVAVDGGKIVGVAQVMYHGDAAELDKLFVDPDALGGGIGRRLFGWSVQTALSKGAKVMTIDADPGAADFYRRLGAVDDGTVASTVIPGRFLPRLKLGLANVPPR
ncbi:GNAT family N-acetyltransferase [Ensifer sp. HO-A22]|uniref:GNAT family N-acetyltransferase n=1 Tax=Ensifer oleiphilus TaxID=2742698 RepID=A0A7Y6Q3D8_9HYPH|nr:GNAT family N-acetyltransferase [Ensifer oleiphilus]NVD38171.1 GNAT family N-acetyltransferase [Ensifer oleiphilus]